MRPPELKIDYRALSDENRIRYGTDVGEWAPELLANLYSERTHFVLELLQNAEDAIRKRDGDGPKAVKFELTTTGLRVSHFGKPFDEADVRGICGINKSTKKNDLTDIGRFGIGFKSVYAVTDRPEIRSAGQHFAIESYVHPVDLGDSVEPTIETSFWFPFRVGDCDAFQEISGGLKKLSARTLLFLRNVEEVIWEVEAGQRGTYYRESRDDGEGLRHVTLVGTADSSETIVAEEWLVFSRPIHSQDVAVGHAEIAYLIDPSADPRDRRLTIVSDSRLAAFFPTGVPTNLGVLVQAPFRTTPARDNVPSREPWNQYLVGEIASLLVNTLQSLKQLGLLNIDVLRGMPLDQDLFPAENMFHPIFAAISEAICTAELLPSYAGGFVKSDRAILARGQELCELLNSAQLTELFDADEPLEWLSDGITADRCPELRNYLMTEHDVREVQPQTIVSRISKEFLEAQPDDWIAKLYEFLSGQAYLWKTTSNLNKPWVRLEDGSQVVAYTGDQPNAFLPSTTSSGFATVSPTVCQSEEGLNFLRNILKLSEPDPVDDVIANILPAYVDGADHADLDLYRLHLRAIERAYENRNTRDKLVSSLKSTYWVPSVDTEGNHNWLTPFHCYLPTERLKRLFEGVPDVDFIDDSIDGLQGESIRSILVACGCPRYLDTVRPASEMTHDEKLALRREWGDIGCSGNEKVDDHTLYGLDGILKHIAGLAHEQAFERSQLLWDSLADVVQDRRESVVRGSYSWSYYSTRTIGFEAAFVRVLRNSRWIPLRDGTLAKPAEVVFEDIEPAWTPNAVLQAALKFRPSSIAQLCEATGISLKILSRLQNSRISEAELLARLGLDDTDITSLMPDQPPAEDQPNDLEPIDEEVDDESPEDNEARHRPLIRPRDQTGNAGPSENSGPGDPSNSGEEHAVREKPNAKAGHSEFVSFIKTHPVEVEDDEFSDTATHEERMRLEAFAIDHILKLEPELQRTSVGNKGFDLFDTDERGNRNRWVEVKAMLGTLDNHPVGMSKAQFELAQSTKTRYWLYIVEHADSSEPRILKIQDPAGHARTFTFDRGWREIALTQQINVNTGEIIDNPHHSNDQ